MIINCWLLKFLLFIELYLRFRRELYSKFGVGCVVLRIVIQCGKVVIENVFKEFYCGK